MNKPDLIKNLLRPDMEDYTENLLEGADEDDAYVFAHEVLDPMTKWVALDHNEKYVFSEMTIEFPKNPYLEGCDEDHEFILDITINRGDDDNNVDETIKEVTKVIIDGEECNLDDIDLDNLVYFASDRMWDGWSPNVK